MTIPQLMTGEQQTVLVHTNASFMLDLGFGVLDAIGSFDVEGDLTGEGHDRNLWFCIDFGELVRAAGQDFDVGRVAIVEDAPREVSDDRFTTRRNGENVTHIDDFDTTQIAQLKLLGDATFHLLECLACVGKNTKTLLTHGDGRCGPAEQETCLYGSGIGEYEKRTFNGLCKSQIAEMNMSKL